MTANEPKRQYCNDVVFQILSKLSKKDSDNIKYSSPVFGINGIIADSLTILDALFEVEKELGIEIPDEDLTESLFESVASFIKYIADRYQTALPTEQRAHKQQETSV